MQSTGQRVQFGCQQVSVLALQQPQVYLLVQVKSQHFKRKEEEEKERTLFPLMRFPKRSTLPIISHNLALS